MFRINREKELKREQMQRELRREHPDCSKLELKKLWRKLKKEKELENWCKELIHAKYMSEENQMAVQALRHYVLPDMSSIMKDVALYIGDCLTNKDLYIIRKGRDVKPIPMNPRMFELLRQEAGILRLGGLERIGIFMRRKHRVFAISATLQRVIEKSCQKQFYKCNSVLRANGTYIDEHGKSFEISSRVREILQREELLQITLQKIRKQYHFIYNMSIMVDNERYPFIKEAYMEELRKDSLVMTAIPDNLIDTYPLARKIRRHFILQIGAPNTGKTYNALEELKQSDSGIYLAPLRLLAYEVQEKLKSEGVPCSMITGEEEDIMPDARHESCTMEKLRCDRYYEIGVIDEAQMLSDVARGWAWTQAILGLCAKRIHICMSEDAERIVLHLIELCGDTFEIVRHERNTVLEFEEKPFCYPEDVRPHDALVVFSRDKVIQVALELEQHGVSTSMIYGALPSNVRKGEMERFLSGETDVVVSTDAIGMGLNLPIERIVFLEERKFDGEKKRFLNPAEVKQIAGRAGRRGIYDIGYVASVGSIDDFKKKALRRLVPIKKARIGFPQTLISLDMKLTDILNRWSKIPDEGRIEKTTMTKEITLCTYMEQHCHFDKNLMMGFATIPFDITRTELLEYWKYLLKCYEQDNGDIDIPEPESAKQLEDMEALYRKYDLIYSFSKVINNDYLQQLILQNKEILSEQIKNAVSNKMIAVE